MRLDVIDTGPGIAAELVGRLFEPFYTTKEGGSGLGLYVSFSILEAHGGALTVHSEPGRGACFSIFLPRSASARASETA